VAAIQLRARARANRQAGLAQLVEQFICNDQVVGSSPTTGSIKNVFAR
jgi:hypothetical protein